MKFLTDINQKQVEKIQGLIEKGAYINIAQFISVAVENQLYLEESGLPEMPFERPIQNENKKAIESLTNPAGFKTLKIVNLASIPKTQETPSFDELVLRGKNENEVWLWGQINKILPIKIGVRVLLRELKESQTILLEDFSNKAAEEAAYMGQIIRDYEDSHEKLRDERISAGLPTIGDEKSLTRYKAQFLAVSRKDGLMDGAMSLLRFSKIESTTSNTKQFIGLTEEGLAFAKLHNPVIDNDSYHKSLSDEEIKFYLNHVKKIVKSEWNGIQWILSKIGKGINEREALNKELKKEYADIWKASDAVINTQRAGLMARMFELGLLGKEKDGIYVTYNLSEYGKSISEKK